MHITNVCFIFVVAIHREHAEWAEASSPPPMRQSSCGLLPKRLAKIRSFSRRATPKS